MRTQYHKFLEWLLLKIEKCIYPEDLRREQLMERVKDLNEEMEEYRYAEYVQEMWESTRRG